MTTEQLNRIKTNIELVAKGASPALVAAFGAPAIGWIAIGQAIAREIPGLVVIADRWIRGVEPTEAEVSEMERQLSVLENADLP